MPYFQLTADITCYKVAALKAMVQTHDTPNKTWVRVFQQFNPFAYDVDHEQVSAVATADQR